MNSKKKPIFALAAALLVAALVAGSALALTTSTTFKMVRSGGAVTAGCLKGANAKVTVRSLGPVEVMNVSANKLPPNREFDLFVTQLPNPPFGVSWYQGDLKTDKGGHATGRFIGRFSVETFAVAPGSGPAPRPHKNGPFPDASSNPAFAPVHTFHLGLWFNSARAAAGAGCPNTVTPFNGVHRAGIQALSTRNFPDLQGPLRRIK